MKVKIETNIHRRGDSEPITIPIFKMRIHNEDHYFIVDTGAEGTLLAPPLIEQAFGGVPPRSKMIGGVAMFGVGGNLEHSPIISMKFNLLGITMHKLSTSFTLFKDLSEQTGVRFSGLLGQDFLRKFKSYAIDNVNKEITFNV